jgi:hypothetical protein
LQDSPTQGPQPPQLRRNGASSCLGGEPRPAPPFTTHTHTHATKRPATLPVIHPQLQCPGSKLPSAASCRIHIRPPTPRFDKRHNRFQNITRPRPSYVHPSPGPPDDAVLCQTVPPATCAHSPHCTTHWHGRGPARERRVCRSPRRVEDQSHQLRRPELTATARPDDGTSCTH